MKDADSVARTLGAAYRNDAPVCPAAQKSGIRVQKHTKTCPTLPSYWAEDLTPVNEIAEKVSFALRNVDCI